MVPKRRVAASLSGVAAWIKPSLYLISIPGYIDDGQAWSVIWRSLGVTMTALDWGLIVVGVPCFLYAFWPRQHTHITTRPDEGGVSEPVAEPDPPSSLPVIPEPRVVTTVDPGESQVSQGKGHPLIVQIFVRIENGLDVAVRLSDLKLDIELKDELLACRFAHFQRRFHNGMDPNIATHRIEQYDEISVPPRQFIDGWVCFKYDIIRIADFKRGWVNRCVNGSGCDLPLIG